MTVQVNIDDDSLNELILKGIKNLSEETIGELAKNAVQAVFQDPQTIKDVLFAKSETDWCGSRSWSNIRPEILNMLSRAFTDDEVKKYRTELLGMLERDKKELMIKVMAHIFIKRVFDDPLDFMNEMASNLSHDIDEIRSRGN